jgi:hypothetical protein
MATSACTFTPPKSASAATSDGPQVRALVGKRHVLGDVGCDDVVSPVHGSVAVISRSVEYCSPSMPAPIVVNTIRQTFRAGAHGRSVSASEPSTELAV